MKKDLVVLRSRIRAGRQRLDAANLRHRIIHKYAEVDTEPGEEKMQRLIAQSREQTKQEWTLDDAIAWNLEELGYEG